MIAMSRILIAMMLLFVQAVKPAEVRKAIQAQYDAWSKAYMANDVDKLLAILAPDYSLKTADGTEIKRPEYEATLKLRKAANADNKKCSTKILKLDISPDTAQVLSRESMISKARNAKSGREETVIHEHDYADIWIRSGDSWLLKRTVTLKEHTRLG